MKKLNLWLLFTAASFLFGCSQPSLITDKEFREKVETDFNSRKQLAVNRDSTLFSIFSGNLSAIQTEAMKFLFAYMPLNDLADYTGSFFLTNADIAIKTRLGNDYYRSIPDYLFLHYVLPVRVNNENLDSFRIKYSDELKERIKGLDPVKAALEINYWCHEKVAYQPADIRTSAPLSTMLSSRGRCGEESTFTVAALRAAGIPARQVYTPRWAHSDDNHAWVEFWANGRWYYMGACEPDAVPDRGWFTEPARRAMLVHTKSFGAAYGNENFLTREKNFSVVNTLSTYAVTKRISVKVTDSKGAPVKGAKVEFQLYNYSEFYPLAVIPSDENGLSSFETGLGDLLIWAGMDDKFAFRKVSVNEVDTVLLKMDMAPITEGYFEFDLGVPVSRKPFEGPSPDLIKSNNLRIQTGNELRKKYIESWIKPEEVSSLAKSLELDTVRVKEVFRRAMGNYKTISVFLSENYRKSKADILSFLLNLADKDLRDMTLESLSDHYNNTIDFDAVKSLYSRELWYDFVLNPRIANEIILPWRSFLFNNIDALTRQQLIADPAGIMGFVRDGIKIDNENNYYRTPITPIGVFNLRVSDELSRDIYYVALCRTLGIPSRLEPGTNRPQYYSDGKWIDVIFSNPSNEIIEKAYVKLTSTETNPVPEYYIHFTLARFSEGRYNTLEYDFNKKVTAFNEELALDPGYYMLMTGNRLNDSRILVSQSYFELVSGEHKTIEIKLRKEKQAQVQLGSFDLSKSVVTKDGRKYLLKELAENGLVLSWIDPGSEPTRHIFNDLPLLKQELDTWGGKFVFLTDPSLPGSVIEESVKSGLPQNTLYADDAGSELLAKAVGGGVSCSTVRLPFILLIGKDGSILMKSEGYRIGIGEQILKNVR